MKLCAMAVLLAFDGGVALAQLRTVSMVTHFALKGFAQTDSSGGVTPVSIRNKDLLNALNATGQFSFQSDAQIILLSLDGQLPTFAVRERNGSNVTTTDISDFFFITEPQELHSADHMRSYAIYEYTFDNHDGTRFTVSGMTTLHAGKITGPGGTLERDRTLNSTVSGTGIFDGANVVLRGTVTGGSARSEID